MNEKDLVAILDHNAKVVAYKERKDVDKKFDILYTTFGIILNSQKQLALAVIPTKDEITNLYNGRYGFTIATFVRKGETRDDAILRGLKNELYLENPSQVFLGEEFNVFPNNVKRLCATYYIIQDNLPAYNKKEIESIKYVTRAELTKMLEIKEKFADTFLYIWEKYSDLLPI